MEDERKKRDECGHDVSESETIGDEGGAGISRDFPHDPKKVEKKHFPINVPEFAHE